MKTWRKFAHVDAHSVEEAAAMLRGGKAVLLSGGTDLLGAMRFEVLPAHPEVVVNLKSVPGLDYIREEGGLLRIGAQTRLEDIARSQLVQTRAPALAEAARRTATPHIREMGSLGGNICQMTRCWYFRNPDNRFYCLRKGGKQCFAALGDNRYHTIFGAVKGCLAVNPGDTAPALVALDARIQTSRRQIAAEQFWDVATPGSTALAADEIVTGIQFPLPATGDKSVYLKFAERQSIDFPVVNCAVAISGGTTRICLNAVYGKPRRVTEAEAIINSDCIDGKSVAAAGAAVIAAARPLPGDKNQWKIPIAAALVKRALTACAG